MLARECIDWGLSCSSDLGLLIDLAIRVAYLEDGCMMVACIETTQNDVRKNNMERDGDLGSNPGPRDHQPFA